MLGLLDLLGISASVCLTLAIIVPLGGALVRYRAHYNPKGLQLDAGGDVQPHTGPIISSYFGMIKRVYKIEGWPGLYKGLMPTLISTLFIMVFVVALLDGTSFHNGGYRVPSAGVLGTLLYSLFTMLVSLPEIIITNRAVTTPHKLPYFKPLYALRVLLTPTERRRPWLIYLTPGLLVAQVSHIAYIVLILRSLRKLLLPALSESGLPNQADISYVKLSIFTVIALLSTLILTPLEVISIRLSIQRNHAAPEYNSVAQEEAGDAEQTVEYAGADEDVIGLRNERDPYTGLIDCAKRIIDEEGLSALYRAWWLTMMGTVGGAFS